MTTLVSALGTEFTPTGGIPFIVQVTGGIARLDRKNTSGATWVGVGTVSSGQGFVVDNPVAGAVYRFTGISGVPVVQADQ